MLFLIILFMPWGWGQDNVAWAFSSKTPCTHSLERFFFITFNRIIIYFIIIIIIIIIINRLFKKFK